MGTKDQKRLESMKVVKDELFAMTGALADERRANNVLPVIGEGSCTADIMFIGEAPGKNEAAKGLPFCGASGKFLDVMLASIGLERAKVYITNVVKDRPTDNRDPYPEEVAAYAPFLNKQMEIIQPKVIATLGRISMAYVMKNFGLLHEVQPISKIHGKVFKARALWGKDLYIIPLYHPAAALYNGSNRAKLLEDFKVLRAVI
ncbi:MAG: uracil-DNA glycosylase [Patescibacteria group bacterium]